MSSSMLYPADCSLLFVRDQPVNQIIPAEVVAIATALVLVFYGHVCHASYQYFRRYPKDGIDLKGVIVALFILTSFHAAMTLVTCYVTVVQDKPVWVLNMWSFQAQVPALALVVFTCFHFFARRVTRLCGPSIVFRAIKIVSLVAGGTLVLVSIAFMTAEGPESNFPFPITYSTSLTVASISNAYMTVKLVMYLNKSRTGFKSTDSMINRLILSAVNTGLITGILTMICAVLVLENRGFAYYPASCLLPPLHASVVLAAVNSRRSIVDRGSDGIELRSFDLDIAAPGQAHNATTIQWAIPTTREEVPQAPQEIHIQLAQRLETNDLGSPGKREIV